MCADDVWIDDVSRRLRGAGARRDRRREMGGVVLYLPAADLNRVTVGVIEKDLPGAIWSGIRSSEIDLHGLKVCSSGVDIVDANGEVVSSLGGRDLIVVLNQMKFLRRADSEPRAGKLKIGAFKALQLHDVAIERRALIEIRHVNRHVVKLVDVEGHVELQYQIPHSRSRFETSPKKVEAASRRFEYEVISEKAARCRFYRFGTPLVSKFQTTCKNLK